MRRSQILKLRAAGLIPPVEAQLRVAWEHTYGDGAMPEFG